MLFCVKIDLLIYLVITALFDVKAIKTKNYQILENFADERYIKSVAASQIKR